jgi:hypothetical protein
VASGSIISASCVGYKRFGTHGRVLLATIVVMQRMITKSRVIDVGCGEEGILAFSGIMVGIPSVGRRGNGSPYRQKRNANQCDEKEGPA